MRNYCEVLDIDGVVKILKSFGDRLRALQLKRRAVYEWVGVRKKDQGALKNKQEDNVEIKKCNLTGT